MTSSPYTAKPKTPEGKLTKWMPTETGSAQGVIAWSSLCFALLQSICTFFAALDGLRLAIGVGSLAFAASAGATLDKFHANQIRIPMIVIALLGSLLNLVVLAHIRRLRKRPASQWRQVPLSAHRRRMERVQLIVSYVTLLLVGIEEFLHFRTFHTL